MFSLYLTPASISYLTQFILSLAITLFLAQRLRNRNTQLVLLTYFFAGVTVFIGLMFLDAALLPFSRLLAVYAQNSVLALVLVFLLLFAYRFPRQIPRYKWESYAALTVSLAYFLWEAGFMVYRYVALLGQGMVYYRPHMAAYLMGLVMLLPPLAFIRQTVAVDPRPVGWWRKLWKPEGKEAQGARAFVAIFGIIFLLGVTNVVLIFGLPHYIYNAALSMGVLMALWLFATTYINFIPGGVSVQTKLSVLTLTLFLALLGSAGWFIASPYIKTFQPNLADQQTLRFTPYAADGYTVEETAFAFESELGERLTIPHRHEWNNYKIDFDFSFYGQRYREIYVSSYGVIAMGQPFWEPNMQAQFAGFPAIFPLLIDLNPNPQGAEDSGVYARLDAPAERLIITWNQLPAYYQPQAKFTFQVILYQNGVFEITTHGLPHAFVFDPDASPRAAPWMRGIVSGQGEPLHANADDLLATAQTGRFPLIQDYQLAFRRYLHSFMLPLALIVIGGSLFLSIGVPLLLRFSIVRPLESLAAGVSQMEAGDLTVNLPIKNEDEIGFLTNAFNTMAARLGELVTGLETQVNQRTSELVAANRQLRAEMAAREQAQAQILEQQRALAVLDERARLSRELHDGLGQVLGYINVQTQAVQTLLDKEQIDPARLNLQQLTQASYEAQADLRRHLLGLRAQGEGVPDKAALPAAPSPPETFFDTLSAYLAQFQTRYGLAVHLWPREMPPGLLLPANVAEQVTRIIQEALTNAAKHAQATRIDVNFQAADDQVQITITDDGVGFALPDGAKPETTPSGHYGLSIMRERAEQVGGTLEIHTAPGKGTHVIVILPRLLPRAEEGAAGIKGVRVVLADDHPLFLDGLRNLLAARGVTVVGLARNGLEAVEKVRALRPDVAVLDLNMPGCNGLEATRTIKAEMPEVRVVILTIPESEDYLYEAVKSGVSGYLYKDLEANQFCQLLVSLLCGEEAVFSPGITERLMTEMAHRDAAPEAELTPRQWEILGLVAQGLTYKEVGAKLHLNEQTIKYHMAQILDKLHLETRAQAIAYHMQKTQE
jgi:signal transduction histidine kinase/DNA-binding NarL/FixJ family response regulator